MIELIFGDSLDCREYIRQFPNPQIFYDFKKRKSSSKESGDNSNLDNSEEEYSDPDDIQEDIPEPENLIDSDSSIPDKPDSEAWKNALVLARTIPLFNPHSVIYYCSRIPDYLDFSGVVNPLIIWLESPPNKKNDEKYKAIQRSIKIKEFPLLSPWGNDKKEYIKSLNPNLSQPAIDYLFQSLPGDKQKIQNAVGLLPGRISVKDIQEFMPYSKPEDLAKKYIKGDFSFYQELEKLIDDLGIEEAMGKFHYQCRKLIKIALMRNSKFSEMKKILGKQSPSSENQLKFYLGSMDPLPSDRRLCQKLSQSYLAMNKKDIRILLLS